MFLKPFTTKSKTIIKGSECKKLRNKLLIHYSDIDETILESVIPSKSEIVLAKLLLHNGNMTNVYFLQNQPILFTYNENLFFTVYSLWKCKPFIPFLITWPAVFEKLLNGADLMLPGVLLNESSYNFHLHQPCAISLKGNSSAVSVGTLVLTSSDIHEHLVDKGKLALILHSYKDLLWSLGDKSHPPQTNFVFHNLPEPKESVNDSVIHPLNSHLQINDEQTDKTFNDTINGQINETKVIKIEQLNNIEHHIDSDDNINLESGNYDSPLLIENILQFDSMDDLIDSVFLYTLKKQKNKLTLPILTSTFYRNFLILNCPKGNSLDIKKTSYKKLSKYLLSKQKEGFLIVNELTKGVDSITSINFEHEKILEFRISGWEINEPVEQLDDVKLRSEFFPPQITDVFLVSAKVQEFFKAFEKKKGDSLAAQDVRQIITDYVKSNSLQEGSNIKLDAMLTDIVVSKNESIEKIDWPQMMQRFLNQMNPAYYMSINQQKPILHKGFPLKIILDVEQRASNKKVTTIQNLKQYGIEEEKFAHTIQRLVSVSASLTIDKSNIHKVIVQGNQIHHIKTLLLETYQIPAKYIVGLDKAIKIKR